MLLNSLYRENECLHLQMTLLPFLEKIYRVDDGAFNQVINRIFLLKCQYFGSFRSDDVPILPNETFVNINT